MHPEADQIMPFDAFYESVIPPKLILLPHFQETHPVHPSDQNATDNQIRTKNYHDLLFPFKCTRVTPENYVVENNTREQSLVKEIGTPFRPATDHLHVVERNRISFKKLDIKGQWRRTLQTPSRKPAFCRPRAGNQLPRHRHVILAPLRV